MQSNPLPASDLPLKISAGLDLLDGVIVLDLTTSIAGPYAGQLLADFGATVIKVERPGVGDDCRAWGPPFLDGVSLWFLSVNRNKQGITLDISHPRGNEVLLQLIRQADVMLVNLPARAQRKLGIDAATLAPVAPGLIHASITGFGLAGERADLPCYDLIAEGFSGVMQMTGEPDSPPQKVGTPAADLLAGEDAALAITAALLRKQRTGQGAVIDISMVESMTRFMAPRLVPYLGSGERMRRSGGRDSVIAIYQAFDTADEPLTLGLGNDAIWRRFWQAVDDEAAAENPAHATNTLRRADRPALVARIADLLKSRRRDEWLEIFARARVPAGPIYRLDEIAGDKGLRDRGFLYGVDQHGTRLPQVGLGIGVDGTSERCSRMPLHLGADNENIFGGRLGLSQEAMTELAKAGII
jgi:crotonobetainyl-CoA:carnitine CoA-transferase CaiB-like acyl-CoA transferase